MIGDTKVLTSCVCTDATGLESPGAKFAAAAAKWRDMDTEAKENYKVDVTSHVQQISWPQIQKIMRTARYLHVTLFVAGGSTI